jgi:histidinol-phosphate aminotransferase
VDIFGYYRQFDDVDELELNRERRDRRARERRTALEQVPDLDLSGTEWPELPHSEIVNAAIARARGRVNGYPDRHASGVRRLLAERHGVAPEQVALGNGAAELLQAAALMLLGEGDEVVMPWPSYPLYPLMATRAGARPVSVPIGEGPRGAPLAGAVTERTRAIVICNPNDPTGHHMPATELGPLLAVLPKRVFVLLDEALVHFQDVEDLDACLRLVDAFPRLLVVRTFSKAYGLSGLRAGYAVGSDADLLGGVAPVLGVNALTQAAVEYALQNGDAELERRRRAVSRERARLAQALRGLPVRATESHANFVWLRADGVGGTELAERLRRQGVLVAPGAPLGAEEHIRATVRDAAATDRLVRALEIALRANGSPRS